MTKLLTQSAYRLTVSRPNASGPSGPLGVLGSVFVVHEDVSTLEPVRIFRWWPAACTEADLVARGLVSGEPLAPEGKGVYRLLDHRSPSGAYPTVKLASDVATVHTMRIEPPKVRRGIELRWNDGRWEKLLAKGWVPA